MTRHRITRLLAAPVAVAVVAAGMGLAPATAAETHSAPSPAIAASVAAHDAEQDGKDLFQAVFFFQGEIADALMREGILTANLQVIEMNRSAEGSVAIDALVGEMAEVNPFFFSTFSEQLRSGDPFQVEAGLTAATDLLLEVAPTRPGGDHSAAWIIAVAAVLAVAVAAVYSLTYGAMVHHTVAINEKWVFDDSEQVQGARGLEKERQVAAITKALATVGTGGTA